MSKLNLFEEKLPLTLPSQNSKMALFHSLARSHTEILRKAEISKELIFGHTFNEPFSYKILSKEIVMKFIITLYMDKKKKK